MRPIHLSANLHLNISTFFTVVSDLFLIVSRFWSIEAHLRQIRRGTFASFLITEEKQGQEPIAAARRNRLCTTNATRDNNKKCVAARGDDSACLVSQCGLM